MQQKQPADVVVAKTHTRTHAHGVEKSRKTNLIICNGNKVNRMQRNTFTHRCIHCTTRSNRNEKFQKKKKKCKNTNALGERCRNNWILYFLFFSASPLFCQTRCGVSIFSVFAILFSSLITTTYQLQRFNERRCNNGDDKIKCKRRWRKAFDWANGGGEWRRERREIDDCLWWPNQLIVATWMKCLCLNTCRSRRS